MEIICCVYKLTNTITGKFYIGSTKNFKSRMKHHRFNYRRNANRDLGGDIEKYGWDAFKKEILEVCTLENYRDRERYYIEALNAVEEGYNMTKATKHSDLIREYNEKMWKDEDYRAKRSEQSRRVQRRRLSDPSYLAKKSAELKAYTDSIKKPVGMYSKEGELLHTFAGIREAERWLIDAGITRSNNASSSISDCCKGGRHKTAYGYIWKYL